MLTFPPSAEGLPISMVPVAVIWLIFAIVVAAAANGRGRTGFGWFILAVVISPLLAGLLLAILPDLQTRALLEGLYDARSVDDEALRQNVTAGQGLPAKKPRSLPWWLNLLLGAAFFGAIVWLLKTGGR
jgi:hypothetical protein